MRQVILEFRWVQQVATSKGGIRVTQAGISDPYAADYQYVFNSDWPSLQIAFEEVVTVTAGGVSAPIPHGLGFYPLTMAWFLINGVSVGRFYGVTTFDKTNVYIDNSLNTSNVTVSIKCYNLDISVPVNYELPQFPTASRPYDPSTGIKVTKYGKSMASNDLRDYILHSRAQSPAVLAILTQAILTGGKHTISYINPANYIPWILGFVSPIGNNTVYQCYPVGSNQAAPAFFQLGNNSVIWTSGTSGIGSLVVLRDPLIVPTTKQVTY
jgi:hypothetical protein